MKIKPKKILIALFGSFIQAFGIYNIHSISGVTEGGIIGLTLLLDQWFGISPAISGFVLSSLCFLLGFKTFGKSFLFYSAISVFSYSASYAVLEQFPRIYPAISEMPVVAAVFGAVFIGVGAGLCIRVGGATGGDDALAMSLGKLLNVNIRWIYLAGDLIILALSLTYIPLNKIIYSLLTVYLSGRIVGMMNRG